MEVQEEGHSFMLPSHIKRTANTTALSRANRNAYMSRQNSNATMSKCAISFHVCQSNDCQQIYRFTPEALPLQAIWLRRAPLFVNSLPSSPRTRSPWISWSWCKPVPLPLRWLRACETRQGLSAGLEPKRPHEKVSWPYSIRTGGTKCFAHHSRPED